MQTPDTSGDMIPTLNMDNYEPEGLEEYQEELVQRTLGSGTVQNPGDLTGD